MMLLAYECLEIMDDFATTFDERGAFAIGGKCFNCGNCVATDLDGTASHLLKCVLRARWSLKNSRLSVTLIIIIN